MTFFQFVWLISAIVVFIGSYLVRCFRLRRIAGPRDLHWPGLLVIALVAGLLPAYIADQRVKRSVEVPETLAPQPAIVKK
jgi:hypothetical protein